MMIFFGRGVLSLDYMLKSKTEIIKLYKSTMKKFFFMI